MKNPKKVIAWFEEIGRTDIAIAGGFSTEDHLFKVLAMGAPYTKAVCMGRAMMIPGMVGKNVGLWLQQGEDALPKTVSQFGTKVEEISSLGIWLTLLDGRVEHAEDPSLTLWT